MSKPSGVITVYDRPTCSKCRETKAFLDKKKVKYKVVEYGVTPLSHKKVKELLIKLEMEPRDLLRKGEKLYKELNLKDLDLSKDEVINIMIKYPTLMQRPIIERGDRAVVGRPPENVKKLL